MATKEKEKKAARRRRRRKARRQERARRARAEGERARGPHAGAKLPVPAPRLKEFYNEHGSSEAEPAVRVHEPAPGAAAREDRDQRRRRRSDQAAEGARLGRRRAGDDHRPAAGAQEGEEVDRQLRSPPGPGDRRGGDAARRADVGVPRPVHLGRDPADSRLPRARHASRSTVAATTRWASRSR